MAMPPNFTPLAIQILDCLPKEPGACPLPEIARDVLGKADSLSLSQIKQALCQLKDYLYVEMKNTRPYGYKDHYGVRADRWSEVQDFLALSNKNLDKSPAER